MKYITLFIFLIPLSVGAQDTIFSVTGKSILVYLDNKQSEDEVRFDMVEGKKNLRMDKKTIIRIGKMAVQNEYSKIDTVANTPAAKLFHRGMSWFALNFGAANEVIQYKDEPNKIIGKGYLSLTDKTKAHFTITLLTKNHAYKVIFNDIELATFTGTSTRKTGPDLEEAWWFNNKSMVKTLIHFEFITLITSLAEHMKKDDQW